MTLVGGLLGEMIFGLEATMRVSVCGVAAADNSSRPQGNLPSLHTRRP
jgi:hypothetical protein